MKDLNPEENIKELLAHSKIIDIGTLIISIIFSILLIIYSFYINEYIYIPISIISSIILNEIAAIESTKLEWKANILNEQIKNKKEK